MWYTCPCCDGIGYRVGDLIDIEDRSYFDVVKCTACSGTGNQWVWVNLPQYPSPIPWLSPTWGTSQTNPCGVPNVS